METAVRFFWAVTKIVGLVLFAVYFLYWIMFLAYIAAAAGTPGAWKLWFEASGPDGAAGPLFLWFLMLINPATIVLVYMKLRRSPAQSNSGVSNAKL